MKSNQPTVKQSITRRAWIVYWCFIAFGVVILGRILYIQNGPESDGLKAKAVDSRTFRIDVIEAERGDILAYDGRVLATSSPYYDLKMDFRATGLKDSIFNLHVDALSECMAAFFKDKSEQQYKNMFLNYRNRAKKKKAKRVYRIAPRQVSHYELSQIKKFPLLSYSNPNVSGFIPEKINKRVLPYGSIAQRTIGRKVNDSLKWGIEGAFDNNLKGKSGQTKKQRISGSFWMPVSDENNLDPIDGYDVITTIDIELQDVAERALREQLQSEGADWGTAVLMEVKTGEIRAMANLSRRQNGTCVEDMNHAIAQRINPGSTFKLANLIVLLEDAGMSLDDVIDINYGAAYIGGKNVKDSHGGPKTMTLREVFEKSSNVGFARAVEDHYRDEGRSKEKQQRYIDELIKTGVRDTIPFQLAGYKGTMLHNTTASTWSRMSITSLSYGYELEMTPIQTLCLYNAVANGGKMISPVIVKELQQYGQPVKTYKTQVLRERICSPKTLSLAQESLKGVATDGTARRLKIQDLDIAVKTGTAQIPNFNKGYGKVGAMNYLATIVGYFPADDPKYTCIVAVKTFTGQGRGGNYYGGSLAGPVFKAIAERVYGASTDWHPVVAKQGTVSDITPSVKGGDLKTTRRVLDKLTVPYNNKGGSNGWVTAQKDSAGLGLLPVNWTSVDVIPDVTGLGLQDAVCLLEKQGMIVSFSGKGAVLQQSITPGEPLVKGGKIHLTLSTKGI